MSVLESVSNSRSLSIRDLLEAREQYHWHLTDRRNVIGTAIGRYLIRKDRRLAGRREPEGAGPAR